MLHTVFVPCAVRAAHFGEFCRSNIGLLHDVSHNIASDHDSFGRVVRDAQADKHVGESHDTQTDLAGLQVHGSDLGNRVLVDIYSVVKEMDCQFDRVSQSVPINSRQFPQRMSLDASVFGTQQIELRRAAFDNPSCKLADDEPR